MVELTIDGVTKLYDNQFMAVEDMNLTIEHGQFFTFVGPSGCGKTTTLRMIAGLESVTEGSILYDGVDVTDLPPQQRDIAMVFQDVILYPHMTVYDNIGYGLKVRDEMEEYDSKIREAAELLDISEQLKKKPSELSGGQQQRVALGRAIVRDPNLILFDEPMSDLDAKLKSELRVRVQQLHQRLDTTMIYVTHDQEEAMTMSDQIGVMNDGVLAQVGTPEEIFNEPINRFISTFIGQPSMNILEGEVTQEGSIIVAGNTAHPMAIADEEVVNEVGGQSIHFGFRPQHADFVANPDDALVSASLDVWEPIGTGYICHLTAADGTEIKMVVENIPVDEAGETVHIGNLSRWYLFDTESGDTIYQTEQTQVAPEVN